MRKILRPRPTAPSAAKSSEKNGGLMKKNELFEMEITGMTAEGNGVGRAEIFFFCRKVLRRIFFPSPAQNTGKTPG